MARAETATDPLEGFEKGRVPRSVRERQLLDVAERVFGRDGYQGTSLESVAQEAGVTRQYLNKLFGDKEGLYLACHSGARAQLNEMIVQGAAEVHGEPGLEFGHALLRACVNAYFMFVRDQGARWDVLFGAGSAVAGPAAEAVAELRAGTTTLFVQLLQRAQPALERQEAELIANAMSGAGNQVALWWRHTDHPLEWVVDRVTANLWQGVAPLITPP